ncbi:MAG: hypothetical protein Q4Q58_06790, partial [Thermoplasmata archaeon]|nr:hypothetical protein [Thermoplasmata archaeon]
MIPSLFDYDVRREAARLRLLDRKMEMRARKGLAIQAALSEHPVSRYVRRLPYEPASYPAIEYLKVEEAEGPETKDSRVPRGTTSRKGPEGVPEPSVQEGSESSLQEGT